MSKRNGILASLGLNVRKQRETKQFTQEKLAEKAGLDATYISGIERGFPCQPFSIAGVSKKLSLGKKHGFEDKEQGNLFFTLADIIDYHRPTAFVLENLKNLRSHDQGRTFQVIHDTLTKALGYTVYYQVIDARSVVPQHRERIFLVGFKERRGFEFPEFPAEGPKLETILEDVPEKYTLTDHLWN
jgi:DNA (cytosine-5)-methyltransferase 1